MQESLQVAAWLLVAQLGWLFLVSRHCVACSLQPAVLAIPVDRLLPAQHKAPTGEIPVYRVTQGFLA
jgi:hypothetical protein